MVDVIEDFEEVNIFVILKGDIKLNDSFKKVIINDYEMVFLSFKMYGLYL